MHLSLSPGSEPNPHALAAMTQAAEMYAIVASQDIVDSRGVKLWAQGQPVSAALQQRLLERRLKKPVEACLLAEDGITPFRLMHDLQALLESQHPLAPALRAHGQVLVAQLKQIPLHAVAQLLLTTAAAARPQALVHAVTGMALAGAMMASRQASSLEVRLAMLGGLLHDIGEIYINPAFLDYTHALDLVGHKHLVVHPRVAQMLLDGLTDYPKALGRGIAEHHERLDRSGYPARLGPDALSTLGRVLSVVEVTLGSASDPHAPLTRASFALRVVPGEFDPTWSAFVCEAANDAREDFALDDQPAAATLAVQLAEIDEHMASAHQLAKELNEQRRTSQITEVVADALHRLERLRVAWNALGLWGEEALTAHLPPGERLELMLAESELRQRLRAFHRECLLLSEGLTEAEKFRLSPLWQGLLEPM
ncbi:HD-GYP domain-containing protein [Piscinibacter sp. HJYY11]|uniref:HD-GYP domain-containing protein n=1 Tax=Piscinibacter sp. HJYY11 TaxID=2801333 RepID=UPI00191D3697|nr:HD domain-containing phosphohydrolase [Piscinibacter sp. HJYY11]MBL0729146.1 HD domain-containing protein [Piscinibacter sp. HJYY11]